MSKTASGAFAPNDDACLLLRAEMRETLIHRAQALLHVGVPALSMTAVLACASPLHALASGALLFAVQEIGKRLPVFGDLEDDDLCLQERIPVGVACAAAIAVFALLHSAPVILWLIASVLTVWLTRWPIRSYVWQANTITDAMLMRATYAHPAQAHR